MTDVRPGNLKLIGRATFLMQSHINDVLNKKLREKAPLSYAEANAILFDALKYLENNKHTDAVSVVGLCIVRVLESLKYERSISWKEAENRLKEKNLDSYLISFEPLNNTQKPYQSKL